MYLTKFFAALNQNACNWFDAIILCQMAPLYHKTFLHSTEKILLQFVIVLCFVIFCSNSNKPVSLNLYLLSLSVCKTCRQTVLFLIWISQRNDKYHSVWSQLIFVQYFSCNRLIFAINHINVVRCSSIA